MQKSKDQYMNELAKYMLENKLALFIGAGFSRIFNYPSWSTLLKDIIEDYEIEEELMETSVFPFINNEENKDIPVGRVNELILERLLGVDYLRLAGYIDIILRGGAHKTTIHDVIAKKIKECKKIEIGLMR